MAIGSCPNPSFECPWFRRPTPRPLKGSQEHGCFSDLDHIVPQRLGTTALAKTYINLPENKQQLCRWDHDEKGYEGDEPLPPEDYMAERVAVAALEGAIRLNAKKKKRIGL